MVVIVSTLFQGHCQRIKVKLSTICIFQIVRFFEKESLRWYVVCVLAKTKANGVKEA